LTDLTPIVIKAEEAVKLYNIMSKSQVQEIDYKIQPKDWLHPEDSVRITEQQDEHAIQIFTDDSKSEHGAGAGIAIFIQSKLAYQLRYTLHNTCSNNQAKQLAIVKALETTEKSHINDNIPRTVTVHTDSRITLQPLKNTKNHNYLIEEIRKKAIALEKRNWTIKFIWIKAHVGIYVNELADKLAKEAARNNDISFDRIPKSAIVQQVRDQSVAKWLIQWDRTTKGSTTKQFFPIIKDRLTTKIKLTPNFTAIVTAHSKTKAYLHRFKIIDSPECPCDGGNQTVDHLLYDCTKLHREREKLISSVSKQDNWPVNKCELLNKHTKHFIQFANSIDFEKL
jgi:ribonuclease HI